MACFEFEGLVRAKTSTMVLRIREVLTVVVMHMLSVQCLAIRAFGVTYLLVPPS